MKKRWIKTDDLQWVRRVNDVNDGYFELIEVRCLTPDTFQVVTGTIDITDYTEKELDGSVSTHYENLECVKESYPDNWKQIVAECVFENSADYELVSCGPYTSEDEAERYVLDNLIKKRSE